MAGPFAFAEHRSLVDAQPASSTGSSIDRWLGGSAADGGKRNGSIGAKRASSAKKEPVPQAVQATMLTLLGLSGEPATFALLMTHAIASLLLPTSATRTCSK
jgi:hypothetical protein